jgi:hypothetical protein
MTVELKEEAAGKLLEVHISGKLAKEDYLHFAPVIDRMVQEHGKINFLVEMHDFHGWTAGALWEDIKLDVKHFTHINKLALVGETKWEKGMASFCRPFTTAKIKYFDRAQADQARTWILSPAAD